MDEGPTFCKTLILQFSVMRFISAICCAHCLWVWRLLSSVVFRNGTYDLLFKGWEVAFGGDTLFYLYRIGKKLRFRAYSGLVEHCILASSIVLMLPLGLSKVLQSCGSTEKSIVLFADTVKNYKSVRFRKLRFIESTFQEIFGLHRRRPQHCRIQEVNLILWQ